MLNEANALERAIDRKIAKATRRRTRTAGVVSRVEKDGTVYVRVEGSDGDTPVWSTTAGVAVGDSVAVRIENGRAAIEGNLSDPSAGNARVTTVEQRADEALEASGRAKAAADMAVADASRAAKAAESAESDASAAAASASAAATSASNAETSATAAQGSASAAAGSASQAAASASSAATAASNAQDSASSAATSAGNAATSASNAATSAATAAADAAQAHAEATHANTYSNAALDQLGVVQDVAGILAWASEHGSFELTSDQSIVDGKVYFTYDSQTHDYAPVVDPQASALPTYYELTVDEPMNDFIMAHLAVTSRGLWVLPAGIGSASDEQHAAGYKMLLASDGMYLYDGSGALVRSDTASGTDFAEGRSFYFGSENAYVLYTPASGGNPESLVIGGANVQLGSSKTLAEWEADMQQAIDDSSNAVQAANNVPIVTVASTNGTVFKRNVGVSTTLVATIYTPGGKIADATELRRRFGSGAYLEWGWRGSATGAAHVIVSTDPRIGAGGFTFTVAPEDIDTQAVITCSLNY